jgi:hypothetical protein
LQRAPGNGETLPAKAQEAAHGDDDVADAAGADVEHDLLELAHEVAVGVVKLVRDEALHS